MTKKYFHEAGNNHYDHRYFRGELPLRERNHALLQTLKAFTLSTQRIGIPVILMHGGLLGWHWNRKLFPWDSDIDISLFLQDFENLVRDASSLTEFGNYQLDFNPNYINSNSLNKHHTDQFEPNRIDARFIDKISGLYIDITILREINEGILSTKCPHHYLLTDILPLIPSTFENISIHIPNKAANVLIQEYGIKSITDPKFESWIFNHDLGEWIHCA